MAQLVRLAILARKAIRDPSGRRDPRDRWGQLEVRDRWAILGLRGKRAQLARLVLLAILDQLAPPLR